MKSISLKKDKSFSLENINNYGLSIRVDTNGLSFSIYDYKQKKFAAISLIMYSKSVVSVEDLYDEIKKLLKENSILNYQYRSVNLTYVTTKYTIVPTEYFKVVDLREFYCFNNELSDYDELHFSQTEHLNSYIVFAIPADLSTLFANTFQRPKFYNQVSVLAKKRLKSKQRFVVNVNMNADCFDMLVRQGDVVEFCNSFKFDSFQDVLYFILGSIKSLGFKISECDIILSGDINEDTPVFTGLCKYVDHISFENHSKTLKLGKTLAKVDPTYFSNLYFQENCE